MKTKLQAFIKQNYGYLCLGILFCCLLLMLQFVYFGFVDDRIYSTVARTSLSDFLYFMRYHYNYVNGRTWIHVLLMVFLRFGIYPWRMFMAACFSAAVYLIARLVSPSAQTLQKALAWTCAAFLCIHFAVYQETLFWVTGSFNYILPAPLLGLLLLALREKKCLWSTPILAFLCGSSMEQFGMISVSCLILWLGYRIFRQKDRSIRGWFIASVLASLAGLLTLVLSPSVRARTYAQTGSLLNRINYLSFTFWFHSKAMSVFLALLALAACVYLFSAASKQIQKYASLALAAAVAVSGFVSFMPFGALSALCMYGFAAAILCACFWAAIGAFRAGHGIPLLALLLGGGAQAMMLVTQRLSMRTTMPSVFCFAVFAVSLLVLAGIIPAALRAAVLACVFLIAAYNVTGYVSFAVSQRAEYAAGNSAVRFDIGRQSREDIDRLIEQCEEVRLQQIEMHQKAAAEVS